MPIISSLTSTISGGIKTVIPPPSAYPSIASSSEVFKFSMNNGVLPFLKDFSSNNWAPPLASRGSTGLSLMPGGPYSADFSAGRKYYYNSAAGNSAGIATLSGYTTTARPYSTYHNNNVATSSWTFECDFLPTNESTQWISLFQAGTTSLEINGFSGTNANRCTVQLNLSTDTTTSNAFGFTLRLNTLITVNTWYHMVFSCIRRSSTERYLTVYVNGKLSGSANISSPNIEFYVSPGGGAYIGVAQFGGHNFGLDNVRLLTGNPFPANGFIPPTSGFTEFEEDNSA